MPQIPRLLGMLDRNPFRPTHGCFDRQFWHYRTACFPSEMYQEGVLPLALVYAHPFADNPWQAHAELRAWIIAGLRYSAQSCHADGSCDDYYPFERALGAAVFSFVAATEACRLIGLSHKDEHHDEILDWLRRRARWIASHGESGTLANHHALAALGLFRLAQLTNEDEFVSAASSKLKDLLKLQDQEGWFCEYGGADPGYQTVTIDCLAKIRQILIANEHLSTVAQQAGYGLETLERSLGTAVRFCAGFLHPDDSYAGSYGSRGTLHFYSHGFELLAADHLFAESAAARQLATAFRRVLQAGQIGHFSDDRMFVHRLTNLLEAATLETPTVERRSSAFPATQEVGLPTVVDSSDVVEHFPNAGMLVIRTGDCHSVISAARGGVFSHFDNRGLQTGDAGVIVELNDGRLAVSQSHDSNRTTQFERQESVDGDRVTYSVRAPLHFVSMETVSPWKQAILHLGMVTLGRFCRTLVRRLLQKRVITGRREAPLVLTRTFEIVRSQGQALDEPGATFHRLRVVDRIELTHPKVFVRRMSFGVGFEAAYVAASGVYRADQLRPWPELPAEMAELNAWRHVEIIREDGRVLLGGHLRRAHSVELDHETRKPAAA
ncbi:MAG: hypothetical protein MPJ50_04760 [Pirellulales bacterium]|nr:hypothetical protein [Pirellulales bacterium]